MAHTQPELEVWYGSMPESNGKSNFTAMLRRKDMKGMSGAMSGITLDQSEYPERVRYEADRARYIIGELAERPHILDYDADKRSDYVEPVRLQNLSLFGKLTDDEVSDFENAARREYTPGQTVNPVWHPAYRAECERMNLEAVQAPLPPPDLHASHVAAEKAKYHPK